MQDQKKTRQYIIIGFIVMSVIIVGIIGLIYGINNTSSGEPNQKEYIDPGSGDTIVSPEGKTPEKYGVNPDAPSYIGFDKLVDVGLAFDQVISIKSVLGDYAFKVKDQTKITEVSLTADSIKHTPNPNGPDNYLFRVVINRQNEYRVIVSTTDISSIQLSLYTIDGTEPIFTGQK